MQVARSFKTAGVTLGSLLQYPIQRRLPHPRNILRLRNGFTITTPREVELTALFHEIWVKRCYAPEPLALNSEDAVIDIGAHVGVFTLWAAAQHPRIRIVSLEPSPQSFIILTQNVLRNHLTAVESLQAGCAGQAGTAELHSRGPASVDTLYQRDLLDSSFSGLSSVPVLTLDDVFERFEIQRCGLLKLDCEGAEYEILLNASDTTLRRIQRIALEYHVGLNDHTPAQLVDFLSNRGFEINLLPPRSLEDGYLHARRRG